MAGCFPIIYHLLLVRGNPNFPRVSFLLLKIILYHYSWFFETHPSKVLTVLTGLKFRPPLNQFYSPRSLPLLFPNPQFALPTDCFRPLLAPIHSILPAPFLHFPPHQTIRADLIQLRLHTSLSHCRRHRAMPRDHCLADDFIFLWFRRQGKMPGQPWRRHVEHAPVLHTTPTLWCSYHHCQLRKTISPHLCTLSSRWRVLQYWPSQW